jgi:dimethylargininase
MNRVRITDYDRAIVRAVPRSYAPAYASKGIHIDLSLADAQHAAYVTALERAGVSVTHLRADEEFYDCVFVEDTAIVWRDQALITRIAAHREGEQRGVEAVLAGSHTLSGLSAGSQLEGGDVLHTAQATFVGLTQRTSEQGADDLAGFLRPFRRPVVPVKVSNTLHLKSIATYLGDGTLLAAPGHVDLGRFDVDDIIETADGEDAANCVRVRDVLLFPRGCPATLERVRRFAERHSVSIVELDLSEFAKGDGSATCLSLLWREG